MFDKINKDMIDSMKNKDTLKLSTLRLLKGAIDLNRINNKKESLTDDEIITIIGKEIKTRKESILEFEKGNRDDLISKTQSEIDILNSYMPESLSEEKINNIITDAITELNATSIKDMGNVMKMISPKLNGRADMSLVSGIIKNKLN